MPFFPPAIDAWIDLEKLPELGPGRAEASFPDQLRSVSDEELFRPNAVIDRAFARLCRSALLLHHDCLDESHAISQEDESPTGSYLHGIMHRREPDFFNAKYWLRRAGEHDIHVNLFWGVKQMTADSPFAENAAIRGFVDKPRWDACAFADLCEQGYREGGIVANFARRVAMAEWLRLLTHCHDFAIGCVTTG